MGIKWFIAYMLFGFLAALLIVLSYDAILYMEWGSFEAVESYINWLEAQGRLIEDIREKILNKIPTFGGFFDEIFSAEIGSVIDSFLNRNEAFKINATLLTDLAKFSIAGLFCFLFSRLNRLFLGFFKFGGLFSPYNIALYTVRAYYLLASYCISIVILTFVQKVVSVEQLNFVYVGLILVFVILHSAFLTLKVLGTFKKVMSVLFQFVYNVAKAYFLWWLFNKFNDLTFILLLLLLYGIAEALIDEALDKVF